MAEGSVPLPKAQKKMLTRVNAKRYPIDLST